jgi:hypothetical protein
MPEGLTFSRAHTLTCPQYNTLNWHTKTCTAPGLMRGPNKIEACFVPSSRLATSLQIPWLSGSQNFNTRLCDPRSQLLLGWALKRCNRRLQQCFFELGTPLSIHRRRCPVIRPMNLFPITSKIYHLQIRGQTTCPRCNSPVSNRLDSKALRSRSIVRIF